MKIAQWLILNLILNKSVDTLTKKQKSNDQESVSPNKTIYMSKSKVCIMKF